MEAGEVVGAGSRSGKYSHLQGLVAGARYEPATQSLDRIASAQNVRAWPPGGRDASLEFVTDKPPGRIDRYRSRITVTSPATRLMGIRMSSRPRITKVVARPAIVKIADLPSTS